MSASLGGQPLQPGANAAVAGKPSAAPSGTSSVGTQPSQPGASVAASSGDLPIGTTVRGNAESNPWKLLKADHDAFRDLLHAWRLAHDAHSKRRIALELSREIVSHASIEEQHVHALYKQHLSGVSLSTGAAVASAAPAAGSGSGETAGDRFYRESLEADQKNIDALDALEAHTKDLVKQWDAKQGHADDALELSYQAGLKRCEDAVTKLATTEAEHMELEEKSYFPALATKMTPQEQQDLYQKLVNAKKIAPTHAHPSRSDNPTLAKITHPIAGAIDRAVDSVLGRK